MLDFYNNTYVVTEDDLPEVLELLKQHPEYKGVGLLRNLNNEKYIQLLGDVIDFRASWFPHETLYVSHPHVPWENINTNPDRRQLAQVYFEETADSYRKKGFVTHEPQSLLTALQRDKQVMKFE